MLSIIQRMKAWEPGKYLFHGLYILNRMILWKTRPKNFFGLAPGREVRLRYAYFITCKNVIKDEAGNIVELQMHI